MFAPLESLNALQREAATFDDAPLRVIAGPGTGKTTTLTARVGWLLDRGVEPERILLLTFTRRAAREMLQRAAALATTSTARRVAGGTFHSVAHRVLRRHHAAVGLPEGFGILDRADTADLLDVVRADRGLLSALRRQPRKATLASLYSRTVNTGSALEAVMREDTPWCADAHVDVGALFRAYTERKHALGVVDLDDLLLYWRAAAQDAALGDELAAAYDHVLVDEFQDVNALQLDVLVALRRGDPRVTLVGDDAQAIYGFRGASPRFLLDAEQYFPGLCTVTLETNYRSTQKVLDVANALAAEAPEGFSAVLREHVPHAGAQIPQLVRCEDERGQSVEVADRILELYEQGVALHDQAVLFRASHHSADLELELSRRRVPFVKYGGLRYIEAAHVKDLLSAFRLADNPRDEMAWLRLLQRLPGVGPQRARRTIDTLRDDEGQLPLRHDEVARRWERAAEVLPGPARHLAGALVRSLGAAGQEEVVVHAERIRIAVEPLIMAAYEDSAPRIEDLGALVQASSSVARLTDVAADEVLDPPTSTGDLAGPPLVDEDWLVLSTVHSVKGLEFDAVHVIHAADGNFPSDMSTGTPEGIEEERRLFYVAMTRARRHLAVYVPLRYHRVPRRGDDHSWAQPSRFLSEVVRLNFDHVRSSVPIHAGEGVLRSRIDGPTRVADHLANLF